MAYSNSILELVMADESRTAVLRKLDEQVLIKIASAFANASGGNIVIGIGEGQDEICGVADSDVKKAIRALTTKISPSLPYTFNVLNERGRNVLVISIWEGGNKPYTASDCFYTQQGDTIRMATLEQVDVLFGQRKNFDLGWERIPFPSIGLDKLSKEVGDQLKDKLCKLEKCGPNAGMLEVCSCMGFIADSVITNAGVVVMSDRPSEYLPQMRIRVSTFGKGGNEELINVRMFDGNLIKDIDEITSYILKLYPQRIVINDNKRKEVETLPKVALREGILNACVHRRYDLYDSFVAINLYADSVEIVNTGKLPDGITVGDLSKKHKSILRNPDIANAFFLLDYIETAGSGTQRILNECRINFCTTPFWKDENGMVTLTFPSVSHGLSASIGRDWEAISKGVTADVSVAGSLAVILSHLSDSSVTKLAELTVLTGKSYPTVKRYTQMLKQAGLIKYQGNARTGGWVLNI